MNDNIEYEKFAQEIYNEILKNLYVKNIEVMHNVELIGKSGQKHQIDVYWEYQYDNTIFKIAIECKNYNHTVSIGKVRDFFGVLYDKVLWLPRRVIKRGQRSLVSITKLI